MPRCKKCGNDIEKAKWIKCSNCNSINHLKYNKKGRLKKQTCHPPHHNPPKKENFYINFL